MVSAVPASVALDEVIRDLGRHCGAVEVTMPGEDFDGLVKTLSAIRRIVLIDEREIGSFRLADAARRNRPIIDQLAADQFEGLARDVDGKVVRPDFGGKR
ncbi:hypothetical protein P7F60_06390 [Rhizobium sp. YJ-22]|uniref:hypothetical protein n=1 Tax=Rhizobium sp. YJ-22 TaxID=3037556 RepID=UPI002412B265|nr:hypothetical protein [Rhizobium sp. YJ-22]MDG3576005.1 hypothetical protein [Rhizobium sp. YJ-22]